MQQTTNFSEAGQDRVRIDFARHMLCLPADYQISILDLEEFDHLIQEAGKPAAKRRGFQELISEIRGQENVVIAARKDGFPIVIYGPQTILEKDGYKIIFIENEIARTPTAVLSIAAFTQQNHEIVIRKQALEHIFYRKWAGSLDKDSFIEEMLETTIVHEICHAVIAEKFKDQDLYIFGKMLDAYLPQGTIDTLNELLAEWEPKHGAIPYLAKLAETNYPKAKRMFYRYLTDANFKKKSDQDFLFDYAKLFANSLRPYIKSNRDVDFAKILEDAPFIYQGFLNQLINLLKTAKNVMQEASFEFNGLTTNFETLAKIQKKKFKEQDPELDENSALYQRYFWANLAKYFKKCAPDTFQKLNIEMQKSLSS